MAASVRIEDEAFSDERYGDLAAAAGLADADHARGKMARLWRQCTIEQSHHLSAITVTRVLGERGVEALVEARLGEVTERGIRIRGTKGRIEWLKKLRDNGKFGSKGGRPRKNPQGLPSKPTRVPENQNPETPPAPAPADLPEEIPPARAIPPSTDQAPAAVLWQELEQARAGAAVELGVEAQPLTAFDVGQGDLTRMLADARRRGQAELDKLMRQARHVIAMARLETTNGEKPFEWFTGVVFQPNNFRRLASKTATPTVRAPPRRSAGRADRDHQQTQPPRKTTIL